MDSHSRRTKRPPILQSVSFDRALLYPHVPRSTATLTPGQYWGIRLPSGIWGVWPRPSEAGHFRDRKPDPLSRRLNAMDRQKSPAEDSIAGAPLLDQARAEVKAILETGPEILGYRALERDGIEPRLETCRTEGAVRCGCSVGMSDCGGPSAKKQRPCLCSTRGATDSSLCSQSRALIARGSRVLSGMLAWASQDYLGRSSA
jgi:hypothetical protein